MSFSTMKIGIYLKRTQIRHRLNELRSLCCTVDVWTSPCEAIKAQSTCQFVHLSLWLFTVYIICFWWVLVCSILLLQKISKINSILFWPSIHENGQFSSIFLKNVQWNRIFYLFCGFFKIKIWFFCDENDLVKIQLDQFLRLHVYS